MLVSGYLPACSSGKLHMSIHTHIHIHTHTHTNTLQDFDVREGSHEWGPYYHHFDVQLEPVKVSACVCVCTCARVHVWACVSTCVHKCVFM